ncbi:eight-cysteine-cluster domain-containing protein [Candidatus Woesearchaeota archaeon]|nr:eight-cysteine-cluster domain-containing protein [Candidatus Woesearchaeota archaeon]
MKVGFFFIIVAVLAAVVMFAGCKTQTDGKQPPLQPQPPKENVTVECSSDSDCGVGGCSGQVCTAASEAAGVITTCEYRAEYDCLKLTSCGCVEGKCAWKETAGYMGCLDKLNSQ